jgi:hypothetical protein
MSQLKLFRHCFHNNVTALGGLRVKTLREHGWYCRPSLSIVNSSSYHMLTSLMTNPLLLYYEVWQSPKVVRTEHKAEVPSAGHSKQEHRGLRLFSAASQTLSSSGHLQELPGPNLGPGAGYTDWGFSWFSSVPPEHVDMLRDSRLQLSFEIIIHNRRYIT